MRKNLLLFTLLILFVLLTGCVRADLDVKVNKDGSVDTTILFAMEKESYSFLQGTSDDPFPEMKEDMESEGFTVEKYDDDEYTGYVAKRTFANIKDFSLNMDEESPFQLTVDKNFFTTKYVLEGTFSGEEDIADEERVVYNQFDVNFNLELPGKIKEHNADKFEENQLSWKLNLADTTDVYAESTVTNTGAIVLIGALVVAIIAGIVFFMKKTKQQ